MAGIGLAFYYPRYAVKYRTPIFYDDNFVHIPVTSPKLIIVGMLKVLPTDKRKGSIYLKIVQIARPLALVNSVSVHENLMKLFFAKRF